MVHDHIRRSVNTVRFKVSFSRIESDSNNTVQNEGLRILGVYSFHALGTGFINSQLFLCKPFLF